MKISFLVGLAFCCAILSPGIALGAEGKAKKQPMELGDIPWLRDYDQAVAQAKKDKKPILLLFQEVPG